MEITFEEQTKFVESYQCPGCVCGSDMSCFEKGDGIECGKHAPGTTVYPIVGKIFLGMMKGFDHLGSAKDMKITGFKTLSDGWGYDKFNVPVWKYLDEQNHTIVRGMSPRINAPFLHVFLENCISRIDCYEITVNDLDDMD